MVKEWNELHELGVSVKSGAVFDVELSVYAVWIKPTSDARGLMH